MSSKQCPECYQTEIPCIPLTKFVSKGNKKEKKTQKTKNNKKSTLVDNKLESFNMGDFSVAALPASGYFVFYPTTIQFLSVQRELNLLQ